MERVGKDPGQAGWPASLGSSNGKIPNGNGGKEPEEAMDAEANSEFEDDTQGLEVHQAIYALREVQRDVNRTAARVMGLNPEQMKYLQVMRRHGGTVSESRIEQLGEPVSAVRCDFKVLPAFAFLKLASASWAAPVKKIC